MKKSILSNIKLSIEGRVVVDRNDPHHTLWCFKLQLHDDLENLILDIVGGEFLSGLSE